MKPYAFKIGDVATVNEGPFRGVFGVVVELSDNGLTWTPGEREGVHVRPFADHPGLVFTSRANGSWVVEGETTRSGAKLYHVYTHDWTPGLI